MTLTVPKAIGVLPLLLKMVTASVADQMKVQWQNPMQMNQNQVAVVHPAQQMQVAVVHLAQQMQVVVVHLAQQMQVAVVHLAQQKL
jgi:hypothetical protein